MRYFTIILVTFYSLTATAQKNNTDSTTLLDDVIVTTKPNAKNINTARSVEVISAKKQQINGTNTLHSLLNAASGVYMVDMGNEQHAMSIRLPMNYNPLYNYLENGIPLRPVGIFNNNELLELNRCSIDKVEIIKGPFSGSYGAQSIGASINFIQNNYDNAANQLAVQSNGYGQWETLLQLKTTIGKTRLLFNANNSQRNVDADLHFNYAKQAYSLRLEREINKNNNLVFQSNIINYTGDQRDGYDSANFYNGNYSSFDRFSDRKTLAIRNTLDWKHKYNSNRSFNITLFNRIISEEQNPFYLISYVPPYTGRITKDKFVSLGINANHAIKSTNNKFQWNQTVYADFTPNNTYTAKFIDVNKVNGVNVSYSEKDSFLTNYKANLQNIAASTAINFTPNKNWVIYAGLRYDLLHYYFTNYLPVSSASGAASGSNNLYGFNPEASVLYKINNENSFYAQYSSGFTPPTLSNLYRDVTTTPDLTPAKYYNTEVGYKFIITHFNIQLSLYNMDGVDEFISVITPAGVKVVNAGKTNHQGIELKFAYAKNGFEFNYNPSVSKHIYKKYQTVDWSGNANVYDGNKMFGAPGYLHYANATYHFKKFHSLKFIAEWNKVGSYEINAANTSQYEGYDLFNLKSTFTISKLFVNVGVNNIFNKIYATNADGTYGTRYYPGLPRTLQVGIAYKF